MRQVTGTKPGQDHFHIRHQGALRSTQFVFYLHLAIHLFFSSFIKATSVRSNMKWSFKKGWISAVKRIAKSILYAGILVVLAPRVLDFIALVFPLEEEVNNVSNYLLAATGIPKPGIFLLPIAYCSLVTIHFVDLVQKVLRRQNRLDNSLSKLFTSSDSNR